MKGFVVTTLRNATGDFTNSGMSARFDRFYLIGHPDLEIFDVPEDAENVLRVEMRGGAYCAKPLETPAGTVGGMAGGNFVYSCDGRFRRAFGGPISVHDRFETPDMYRMLSR